ncbi:MAG: hypothetical protein IPK68_13655 [Bdellovibrionales bacterium]|nr:hypothetical protein [Bdellovibrionales bacterium]
MQSRDRCHFWFGMGVFFYLGLAVFGLSAMGQKAEAQIFFVKSNSTLTPDGGERGLNNERLMVLDSSQGRIGTLDDLGQIPDGETIRASSVSFDRLSEHIALARANLEGRERKTRELHSVLDELLEKDVKTLGEGEKKRLDRQFPALATVFEVFVNGLREEIKNVEGGPTGGSETVRGAGAQPPKGQLDLEAIERLRKAYYEFAAVAPIYNAIDSPRYHSEGNIKMENWVSAPVLSVKGRLIDLIDLYYLLLSEATKANSSAAKLDGSSKAQVAMENAFRVLLEIYVTVGKSNDLHLNKGFHIIQSVGFSVASVALGRTCHSARSGRYGYAN